MIKFSQEISRNFLAKKFRLISVKYLSNLNKSNKLTIFSSKHFTEKDYKDKFKSFAKKQEVTPEQAENQKLEEEKIYKDSLDEAKKKYEDESKRKKDQFEKIKRNEPSDTNKGIEIDISLEKIKNKFSNAFNKIKNLKLTKPKDEIKQKNNSEDTIQPSELNKENTPLNSDNINKIQEESVKEEKQQNEEKKEKSEEIIKPISFGKKYYSKFSILWQKTFPGEENIELRFERRREDARILKDKIKDATEEEIQEVKFYIINFRQNRKSLNGREVPWSC